MACATTGWWVVTCIYLMTLFDIHYHAPSDLVAVHLINQT